MAKVAFSKLGLKINSDIKTIEFNEQIIEIKQYLPVNEKLELITEVLNNSADENNFANTVKVDIYVTVSIIEAYTNISFTEKQKENIAKLYDFVISTGFYDSVINHIPHAELESVKNSIYTMINEIYHYRNSALGILESVSSDYSNLQLDVQQLQSALADPSNMTLLKDVVNKLG